RASPRRSFAGCPCVPRRSRRTRSIQNEPPIIAPLIHPGAFPDVLASLISSYVGKCLFESRAQLCGILSSDEARNLFPMGVENERRDARYLTEFGEFHVLIGVYFESLQATLETLEDFAKDRR